MLPIVDRRNILRSAAADDAFAALRQAETEVGSVLQPVRNHLNGSLTRFSGQFTCRHHAASAAAAGLLSYSTGLRSPIEV